LTRPPDENSPSNFAKAAICRSTFNVSGFVGGAARCSIRYYPDARSKWTSRRPTMAEATDVNAVRAAPDAALAVRQCRHGTMMYLRRDRYVGRSFEEYGEYSEGEVDIFRQILRPGDVALDVGANFGSPTTPRARFVGPGGFVHAFEPQRILFQILCGNVALNELANVRALPLALGRSAGSTKIPPLDYRGVNNFGGIALGATAVG